MARSGFIHEGLLALKPTLNVKESLMTGCAGQMTSAD